MDRALIEQFIEVTGKFKIVVLLKINFNSFITTMIYTFYH